MAAQVIDFSEVLRLRGKAALVQGSDSCIDSTQDLSRPSQQPTAIPQLVNCENVLEAATLRYETLDSETGCPLLRVFIQVASAGNFPTDVSAIKPEGVILARLGTREQGGQRSWLNVEYEYITERYYDSVVGGFIFTIQLDRCLSETEWQQVSIFWQMAGGGNAAIAFCC